MDDESTLYLENPVTGYKVKQRIPYVWLLTPERMAMDFSDKSGADKRKFFDTSDEKTIARLADTLRDYFKRSGHKMVLFSGDASYLREMFQQAFEKI